MDVWRGGARCQWACGEQRVPAQTGESDDLVGGEGRVRRSARGPPRGGHADGAVVPVRLVVRVDAPHALDSGVIGRLVGGLA